jgi:hypothetical protein
MACKGKNEMIMKYLRFVVFVVVVVLLAGRGIGQADETADAGRKIMNSYKDAVVKIKVVMQSKFVMNGSEMQNKEYKNEITGTVLDSSGLVLVSLTALDPSKFMNNLMSGMDESAEGNMKMEMKLDLKGIKVILPDETELDAKVVLRDKDLDMAFILPKQAITKPMASVNMTDQSNPNIMDEIIILSRLSKVANYAPSIMSARISAIVNKPHKFYIPQLEGGDIGDIGTPAFTLDGKLAGVSLIRTLATEGGAGFGAMMGSAGAMGIAAVIMPVNEILEASKQVAKELKEEKKK